jgi:hypothetical protein
MKYEYVRYPSGNVLAVKKKPLKTRIAQKEEPPVVHTDTTELSKKLSSLQIGGNVLAKKKYISF